MTVKNRIALILVLVTSTTVLKAQTGGPGQPEFMQFKPATATDLVNPSSGGFSYNIPLFDVGGYPVNLSYQSGVQMEDVASIVGLGWQINVGAVTHTMRGIPDDFNGDLVVRNVYMRPNFTYGANLGGGLETAGFPITAGLNAGIGMFYNSYNGYGVEAAFGLSFSMQKEGNPMGASIGLGMKANSMSGVDIYAQPTVSMHSKNSREFSANGSLGGTISINSRDGIKESINASVNISRNTTYTETKIVKDAVTGAESSVRGKDKTSSNLIKSFAASYSFSKTPEIPRVTYPFATESYTGNFKVGGEVFFLHPYGEMKGYYTSQTLSTNTIATPAYGFLYSDKAGSSDNVLLDFSREKDQAYIKDASINIGIPYYTPDIYSVNAQGISGSFQLNRGDVGVVFDNQVVSPGTADNIGGELGLGNATHVGVDMSTTSTLSICGKWNSPITNELRFKSNAPDVVYQSAYFKNASDVSVDENGLYERLHGDLPVAATTDDMHSSQTDVTTESTIVDDGGLRTQVHSQEMRKKARDPRTVNIQYKTAAEAAMFGLDKVIKSYRLNDFTCNNIDGSFIRTDGNRRPHHISEITSTNTDGMRYVFGLPTYNLLQKEVSFTLRDNQLPGSGGLVAYNPNESWGENGKDGFYESTTLPPYVTSNLLTAVLSPDYIDIDGNGPSLSDVGNYVKINYTFAGIYKWRTPYGKDSASFNKAFLCDSSDNKANYVYGEKELWYTHSIESKTEIAEFYYCTGFHKGRKDGIGVLSEEGSPGGLRLYELDSIKVYSINERVNKGALAIPIKIIYFTYDYSLCPGIKNFFQTTSPGAGTGKLTLRKVSFASGTSRRDIHSPYEFKYGETSSGVEVNPSYGAFNVNRWGNYQPTLGHLDDVVPNPNDPLTNIDFPYSSQNEVEMTKYAYAWNLTTIKLPSSGSIKIEYEPHHYAYTQDKRCMEMCRIDAAGKWGDILNHNGSLDGYLLSVELPTPITGANQSDQLIYKYFDNDITQWFYYKALVTLIQNYPEWITGYCKLKGVSLSPDGTHALINLQPVNRDDDGTHDANPIRKKAWQDMRMFHPELSYGTAQSFTGGLSGFLHMTDLFDKVGHQMAAFFSGFQSYAEGQNFAPSLATSQSFLRLYSPNRNKIIGGSRVKRITTNDNWNYETGSGGENQSYTIDYEYTNISKDPVLDKMDTVSSGVVEYEPFNGQDENPLRQPVFIDQQIKMAPDNQLYIETPYNESLFPATNLIYSKVTITSNKTTLPVPSAGHQELEFFTARDYPVWSNITYLGDNHEKKTDALAALGMSILGITQFHDFVTLSQGASIVLNGLAPIS